MRACNLAGFALLGVALAWLLWQVLGPDATPPASPAAPPTPAVASAVSAETHHGKHWSPGSQTRVPHPTTPRPASPHVRAPVAAPDPAEAPEGLTDRRSDPGPDAKATVAAVNTRVDAVRDDIAACIKSWTDQDPDLGGSVMVRFQLDADGLQDAWVEDQSDVPAGPLSCFSAAVYGQDWSGISQTPVEVSFPFSVSADAGRSER